MQRYGYVYKTTNLINNKIYFGQRKFRNNSKIMLFKTKYKGSGQILRSAFKKYGKENFKVELVKYLYTQQQMNNWESLLILFGMNHKYGCYNIKPFGRTSVGFKYSEESKLKMSISAKGKPHPWQKGNKLSNEQRKNISNKRKLMKGIKRGKYKHSVKRRNKRIKLISNSLQIKFFIKYDPCNMRFFKPNIVAQEYLKSL